jgi:hypothetical protein
MPPIHAKRSIKVNSFLDSPSLFSHAIISFSAGITKDGVSISPFSHLLIVRTSLQSIFASSA